MCLIKAASVHTGLSERQIHSKRRHTELCEARWACWVIMRKAGMTLIQIGEAFGRGHDTVIYGLKAAEENLGARDHAFRRLITALESARECEELLNTQHN